MLSELLQEILLAESVSDDDINSAIDNHQRVIINYNSHGEGEATGARVIEVYAYGLSKAGNPVIRAFQPYGDTSSSVPSWKFFRVDRIDGWQPTKQTFNEPASEVYRNIGDFNPNGDATMGTVYKVADFGGGEEMKPTSDDSGPKLKTDVYKTDTERRMSRTRQQLNNPLTIDDIKMKNGFTDTKVPDANASNGPKLKNDNQDDVYKTDTERGMERLRQQLDNPTKIDLSKFNKPSNKNDEIEQLRQGLGDTTEKMTVNDLNKKLQDFNSQSEQNAQDDVYKTDTERGMERLRQQLDNPTKIDLSKFNRNR